MNGESNYLHLLATIRDFGYSREPAQRQEIGTRQIDTWNFAHDLRDGFPLLTTKDVWYKGVIHELLWFLRGDTNIKYLVDNGVNIWNKDAYNYFKKSYPEMIVSYARNINMFIEQVKQGNFIEEKYTFGDLGNVYGKQWRNWNCDNNLHIDQIAKLIRDIKHSIETGYNNRRLIVNAWNVADIPDMALPPCHYMFEVILEPMPTDKRADAIKDGANNHYLNTYINEHSSDDCHNYLDTLNAPKYYLNLKWHQRSVDTFLGLPFNIASYATLSHILGKITNTVPKMLYGDLTNVHIYDNHWEQVNTQLDREPRELPTFEWSCDAEKSFETFGGDIDNFLDGAELEDFVIKNYNPHPAIKAEMVD